MKFSKKFKLLKLSTNVITKIVPILFIIPTVGYPNNILIAKERKTSKKFVFISCSALLRHGEDKRNNKCHYKKVNTVCKCLVIFVLSLMIGDRVRTELWPCFFLLLLFACLPCCYD